VLFAIPVVLNNGNVNFTSIVDFISNPAVNIFKKQFWTDLNYKTITLGEVVNGSVSLNCSRCFNFTNGKKCPFSQSCPIYIAFLLTLETNIYSCCCVAVEPILKKNIPLYVSNPHPFDKCYLKFESIGFNIKNILDEIPIKVNRKRKKIILPL